MRPVDFPLLVSLLVTAGVVAAGPIAQDRTIIERADSTGISPDQVTTTELDDFKFYAQWAGSSYCNDDAQPGAKVACSADVCPDLQASNATVIGSFNDKTLTSMEGFVGLDPTRNQVVVSFRGTSSIRNALTDINFIPVPCADNIPVGDDSDCAIHSGFRDAWNEVKDDVYSFLAAAQTAAPNHTLVATGHSLGGAVATIAAAQMRADGFPCDLYTYGSPRVGNEEFVQFVDAQPGNEFRVTHFDDPVPRLPPTSELLGGFRHTSPEFWLTIESSAGVQASAIDTSDIQICEGTDNDSCNAGQGGFNVEAHLFYFRAISACGAGLEF